MEMKAMKSGAGETNAPEQTYKYRVAAYCRVSTDLEEQEGSFETQMHYYREKIVLDGGFLISYMPMTEEKKKVIQDESWRIGA